MRDDQDAFGHALLDHFEGRTGLPMIERDDGFVRPSLEMATFFREAGEWWPGEIEALPLVKGTVLDAGCGAGRHALHLQEEGHNVVAIDHSPLAVEVCRLRGIIDVRLVPLEHAGPSLGTFDTVLMLCGGFGLLGTRSDGGRTLRKLARMTTDDAVIIAESVDPHVTDGSDEDDYIVRNRRRRGRMPGQMRVRTRYRRYATPWVEWLNASPGEVMEVIEDTGWYVEHQIKESSAEFIVVLRKS